MKNNSYKEHKREDTSNLYYEDKDLYDEFNFLDEDYPDYDSTLHHYCRW